MRLWSSSLALQVAFPVAQLPFRLVLADPIGLLDPARELLALTVDAIEVMHPDVPAVDREMYTNMARFRGKFVTGGSDDHGKVKQVETLGTVKMPETLIEPILQRMA